MSIEALLREIETILDRPSPPTTNVIELDAVTRFSEAVGDPLVDDSGRVLVPPTFLCALRYRRAPMPIAAEDTMLIVKNVLTLTRLPVIGERVTTSARFTGVEVRGPLIVLTLACEYTDECSRDIAVFTCSWLIDTEREPNRVVPVAPRARCEPQAAHQMLGQSSVNGHGFPDTRETRCWPIVDVHGLLPGTELPPLTKEPLSTVQFVKYAGASHDYNPIHYDSHCAARAGFHDVIAPGLLKMAFFAQHVTLWSNRWGRLRRLEATYRGVDFAGACLTSLATVKRVENNAGRPTSVSVALRLADESGQVHTLGGAEIDTFAIQ